MYPLQAASKKTHQTKGRFLILLVCLFFYLFMVPLIHELVHLKFLLDLFFSILLITVLYTVSLKARGLVIGLVFAVPMIVSIWLNHFVPLKVFGAGAYGFAVFFIAYAIWVILRFILSQNTITGDIIYASVAVYLLIGLLWALLYAIFNFFAPGSFSAPDLPIDQQTLMFAYYSFITLTTLGYGDITPLARWAVSLSALEAVIGQLYLAVLVARLVGMHISQAQASRQDP